MIQTWLARTSSYECLQYACAAYHEF